MKKNKMSKKNQKLIISIIILLIIVLIEYFSKESNVLLNNIKNNTNVESNISYFTLEDIPEYKDKIYVEINENKPYFTESDYTTKAFENYSELDSLGRCGVAYANICKETMPPKGDKRGDISSVRPSGWKQAKVNGEYLYNRCHLIAYSLSDEDANEKNLITGTRSFNVNGMLTFETKVLDYMKKNKNNHVLYRVTPVFKGDNLLASGVEMEAYSVEDNGKGVCFNVFVYNVQKGANIDYSTGKLTK